MPTRNPNLFISHRIVESIQSRGREGGTQAPFIMGTKGAHSIRRWNNNPPFFNSFTVVDGNTNAITSTGVIGSTFEFNVSASDFDNDTLTYSWSISGPSSPSLSLSNADKTATFTAAARGDYTITVSVSDEFETISQTKTVSVLNRAPTQNTFTIDKTSGWLTDSFVLTMVSNTDPDGDPVTITWSGISSDQISVTNPSSISSQATVTPTSAGTFTITATVSDGEGGTYSNSKTINVAANTIPAVSITSSPATGYIDTSFDITTSITNLDPGKTLTYSWTVNGGAIPAASSATGVSLVPGARGTHTVVVTIDDEYNTNTASTTYEVENRVPSLGAISISPSTTGNQETVFTASVTASNLDPDEDPDNDITYHWSISSPGGFIDDPATLTGSGDTVTFDPPNGIYGNYTISVYAEDQHGGTSSTQTRSITVQNRAPIINNFTVNSTSGYITNEFTFNVDATDPDGGVLAYVWTSNVDSSDFSTSNGGRTAIYRPRGVSTTGGFKGDHNIYVTASDIEGASVASNTLTITISDRPPVASITRTGNLYVGEEITLSGADSQDPDGDTLGYEWRISSAPGSSTAPLSSTTNPSITFNPDQAGSYTIELIVTADGVSDSATTTFEITQLASYPTVTITPNYYSGEGAPPWPESFTGQAFDSGGTDISSGVTWNWSLSGPVGHNFYLEPTNPETGTVESVQAVGLRRNSPDYPTTGVYTVSLNASMTTEAGATQTGDTVEFSFEITQQP